MRWTSYNRKPDAYQGELEGKTRYARAFLDQRSRQEDYDYTKLEQVLDVLIGAATEISSQKWVAIGSARSRMPLRSFKVWNGSSWRFGHGSNIYTFPEQADI